MDISSSPASRFHSRLSESHLWALTQLLDYGWMLGIGFVVGMLFGGDQMVRHSTLSLAAACALLGCAAVAVLTFREHNNFMMLGVRGARCKRRTPLSTKTLWFVLQTSTVSMSSFFLLYKLNLMHYTPCEPTLAYWLQTFLPFYMLLVLRDVCFLLPLHSLMHTPRFYKWHKTHHEVRSDAQALHAFHIDVVDLLVENVGAPVLLLLGQYALGLPVGLHWITGAMLTMHDGALHSVNPWSVMYFNPLLDYLLEPNVNHQLHHALNKGHYLFVPWSHAVSPERRYADRRKYNEVFKTKFSVEW